MKSKKFNFKDIKGMLTRDEMKKVKGGSGYTGNYCADKPFICHIWNSCWTCEGAWCYDWCGHA